MVGLLRVLKDIARIPSPIDGVSVSFSVSSTTVGELTYPLTEAVQWEQQESRVELYQSLFAALAEHGDLPPGEPALSDEPVQLPSNTRLFSLILTFSSFALLYHRVSAFSTSSFY
jgi:hypothetical protein